MIFNPKKQLIQILIFMTVGAGEEFRFPLASDYPVTFKAHHWQHIKSNSTMAINGIEIDVFQYRVAAESRESIHVEILNPIWKFAGYSMENVVLPESIEISKVLNFRGTPTIYIKIIPWRNNGNGVEVLSDGEIKISVEPVNFPVTFPHPHLLNSKKTSLHRTAVNATEYLIICPRSFLSAANLLAEIHSSEFITEIVCTDEIVTGNITGIDIRDYIIKGINLEEIAVNAYLVLLGDETHIPPIFNPSPSYPSDDFYTTEDPDCCHPQLVTGRIPVSNAGDAAAIVNKIREYIMNPSPGIWRSKVALVADDMYRQCSFDITQIDHTFYSQELYDSLATLLPVLTFYGVQYSLHNCRYPDLTQHLIQTINNGVALINYIGHGDSETWASEKLLSKSRDLPLIHPSQNRLAIWVAGTCSFGDYYGENSFMEDLLLKADGAIAVVATTYDIGSSTNWIYIKKLFGLYNDSGIEDHINNVVDIRLGELVWNAKNLNNNYLFHTFGDPALPLPFPKANQNLVINPPETIHLVQEENISFNDASQHSIVIRKNENNVTYYHENDSIITYTVPGETYVQMDFTGSSTCFRIPRDAITCEDCVVIQAYQEDAAGWNGKIETLHNISLVGSSEEFEDFQGPEIILYQANNIVRAGSAIFPNMDLSVSLKDSSGINVMSSTIGHGIQYKFDDNNTTRIPGNEFIYSDCDSGSVKIPVPLSLSAGKHDFYLEAWDGLNNKSTIEVFLDLLSPTDEDKLHLYKVYPIPSPFSENTNFTMISTHFPVYIIINIYSMNGLQVRTLKHPIIECVETYSEDEGCFIQIGWDGRDDYGNKIANGAYFYHVKAKTNNNLVFEEIYKLAKIE